jgi:hypothetical protein
VLSARWCGRAMAAGTANSHSTDNAAFASAEKAILQRMHIEQKCFGNQLGTGVRTLTRNISLCLLLTMNRQRHMEPARTHDGWRKQCAYLGELRWS